MKRKGKTRMKNYDVALYMLKKIHKLSPFYIPFQFISALILTVSPLINIIFPKYIIDSLIGNKGIEKIIFYVLVIVIGNGLFSFLSSQISLQKNKMNTFLTNRLEEDVASITMDIKYELLEDNETHRLRQRAFQPIKNQGIINKFLDSMTSFINSIILLISISSVIILVDVSVIILLVPIIIFITFFKKKKEQVEYECENDMAIIDRRYSYYDDLICDMTMGKEVRLYDMGPYIMKKVKTDNDTTLIKYFGKMYRLFGIYQGSVDVLDHLKHIIIYAFCSYKVIVSSISIGDYAMMISATNSLFNAISDIITNFISFGQSCKYLELFKSFCELGEKNNYRENMNSDKIAVENILPIRLDNVSFKYSNTNHFALKNVSFEFVDKKHYALVGKNGAGKSTLVKLLMNLYSTTSGEIIVDGNELICSLGESISNELTALFQDYKTFALTIRDNIVLNSENNPYKLKKSIEWAGINEVIFELPNKEETHLYKNYEEDGVELSGGELQKIALARTVYKDSKIIIFDEPTSALDPYAERDIYMKINETFKDKTIIFISHRLSSCKFCDEILVIDEGEIISHGTHKYLIEECDLYKTMWEAQAQYYER